jgi:L-rhamnose isomerase / sugar isomerase
MVERPIDEDLIAFHNARRRATLDDEYDVHEPAFCATVIYDWGSSVMAAQTPWPKAFCLVDPGYLSPNVNIEMIVARLIHAGRLGGFRFDDFRYGNDDLDAGSIDPYRLFLILNELLDAEWRRVPDFAPAHMLDQLHNVTDPIESDELTRAYAQALLVDREALAESQQRNDAVLAMQILKRASTADSSGGAIEPIETYRASGYRDRTSDDRAAVAVADGGIV